MTRIQTNVASLRGLRALNTSNKSLNNSLTRLTTGLKINSGQDNPAGLIASETLRSQVAAIEQSISNSNRASNVIATADAALGEVSSLLIQVRGLIQEGINDGALSQDEKEANQLQIDSALSAINRISSNTTFGGDRLLDGSKSFQTVNSSGLTDFQINEATFGTQSSISVNAKIVQAAEKAELTAIGGPRGNTTLEVGGSKGNEVLFFGKSATATDVANAVNAVKDATGVEATVSEAGRKGQGDISFTEGAVNDAGVVQIDELKASGYTTTFTLTAGAATTEVTGVTVNDSAKTVAIALSINDQATSTDTVQTIIDAINSDDDANQWVQASASGSVGADVTLYNSTAGTPASGYLAANSDLVLDSTAANVAAVAGTNDVLASELTLKSTEYGEDQFVELNILAGTLSTQDKSGTASTRDEGFDVVATINGQLAQSRGLRASVKTSALDAELVFSDAATVNVAGASQSVTINGGGATFQIGQEASTSGQITIGIGPVNTARLGGTSGKLYELASTGGKSLLDVGPDTPGSTLVGIVEEAINEVSTLRGRLGALQKNVIETNVNSLGVALENISEARSAIIDTDFAQETAALTRAQILTQAGFSSLGIANNNPQNVLSLLG